MDLGFGGGVEGAGEVRSVCCVCARGLSIETDRKLRTLFEYPLGLLYLCEKLPVSYILGDSAICMYGELGVGCSGEHTFSLTRSLFSSHLVRKQNEHL